MYSLLREAFGDVEAIVVREDDGDFPASERSINVVHRNAAWEPPHGNVGYAVIVLKYTHSVGRSTTMS